ncbi:hypothetical protein BS78_08G162200 [Paspalum vaginatum]|nr:hypothetical protein BS78_08G162200 [Paspalum vaginatum]
MEEPFIRGVNWAPDSDDDGEESEIRFVMDSLAGKTEVPDSQDNSDVEVEDVALILMQLAATKVVFVYWSIGAY